LYAVILSDPERSEWGVEGPAFSLSSLKKAADAGGFNPRKNHHRNLENQSTRRSRAQPAASMPSAQFPLLAQKNTNPPASRPN